MISSTHRQTANWPASPLCASSNQVDSPICVTPPKRTEYLFESREGWNSQAWPYKVMNGGTTPGHISIEKIQIALLFPVMQWQVLSYIYMYCEGKVKRILSSLFTYTSDKSRYENAVLCKWINCICEQEKFADSHNCYAHGFVNWKIWEN